MTLFADELDAAWASATNPPLERPLRIGGRELVLRFAGPALLDAVLGPLQHHRIAEAVDPSSPEVRLWDTASTGVALPTPPWAPADVGALGRVEWEGLSVLHHPSRSLAVHDPERGIATWWTADHATLPWWERGAPIRGLLHWLLSGPDRVMAHAAAVGLDGAGALLAGPSGSGKSTLALASMHAGLECAGDDYVVLEQTAAGPIAHSLYATAKVTDATRVRWPELVADLQ